MRVIVRDTVRDKWLIVRLSEGSEGKICFQGVETKSPTLSQRGTSDLTKTYIV